MEPKYNAAITNGFAVAPYHIETFPIGSCVCNANGFNCLSFTNKPGAKFTTLEIAVEICNYWNSEGELK